MWKSWSFRWARGQGFIDLDYWWICRENRQCRRSYKYLLGELQRGKPTGKIFAVCLLLYFGFLKLFCFKVQLQLLTATVKLFLKKPNENQDLVQRILQTATTECDNADIRDRAYVYWRLLSTDPQAAKVSYTLHRKCDKSWSRNWNIRQLYYLRSLQLLVRTMVSPLRYLKLCCTILAL